MNPSRVIITECAGCGCKMKVKTHSLQKVGACPKCGNAVTASAIPGTAEPPAKAPDILDIPLDALPVDKSVEPVPTWVRPSTEQGSPGKSRRADSPKANAQLEVEPAPEPIAKPVRSISKSPPSKVAKSDPFADQTQKYHQALNQLSGSAFFFAGLSAILGVVLLFADRDGAIAFAALLLISAALWGTGAIRLRAKQFWAVILVGILAGLNFLGGIISLLGGGFSFPVLIGLVINGGVLTLAQNAIRLRSQNRWNPDQHPEMQDLVEDGDLDALLTELRDGNRNDKRKALRAIAALGPKAVPATPALIELVKRAAPPQPWETDRCEICKDKLTVWNRSLGRQLCASCGKRLMAMRQNPDDVDPSLAEMAADALGQIGPRAAEAVPALDEVKTSKDFRLQQAATRAIRAIRNS
jgi:ribosomal protein S27E